MDYEGQELMYKFRPLVLKTSGVLRGYDKWDEFVKQFDAWKANTLFAILGFVIEDICETMALDDETMALDDGCFEGD